MSANPQTSPANPQRPTRPQQTPKGVLFLMSVMATALVAVGAIAIFYSSHNPKADGAIYATFMGCLMVVLGLGVIYEMAVMTRAGVSEYATKLETYTDGLEKAIADLEPDAQQWRRYVGELVLKDKIVRPGHQTNSDDGV